MTDTLSSRTDGTESPKFAVRQKALEELAAKGGPEAVEVVGRHVATDQNANLRSRCAELLAGLGPIAADPLLQALSVDQEPFVRKSIVIALGRAAGPGNPAAVDRLAELVAGDRDEDVQCAAVRGLASVPEDVGGPTLLAALPKAKSPRVRADIAAALGRPGNVDAVSPLRDRLRDSDLGVAKAAIGALGRIGAQQLVDVADVLLPSTTEVQRRRRYVRELAVVGGVATTVPLARALVVDADNEVRTTAAEALAKLPHAAAKLDAVLAPVLAGERTRDGLPSADVVRGLRVDADPASLTELLLGKTEGADERLTGILADLLVANANGDPNRVAAAVGAYETAHQLEPAVLQRPRIEVGGQQTLDPVLKLLQDDLRENFQKPIWALEAATSASWKATIKAARVAFVIRVAMSIAVFVLGVALIITSVVLFVHGRLTTGEAVGSGTAFAGGLVSTLLTVYSGPLKDIRQSVSDLGAANIAFIGFVHQVLQVSHTFSAQYLRGTVSFEDTKAAADIISAASTAATTALAGTGGTRKTEN